jgi:hypothetical protein
MYVSHQCLKTTEWQIGKYLALSSKQRATGDIHLEADRPRTTASAHPVCLSKRAPSRADSELSTYIRSSAAISGGLATISLLDRGHQLRSRCWRNHLLQRDHPMEEGTTWWVMWVVLQLTDALLVLICLQAIVLQASSLVQAFQSSLDNCIVLLLGRAM